MDHLVAGIEQILAADVAMGNFHRIDHIWMHPNPFAARLGLTEGVHTMTFDVDFQGVRTVGESVRSEAPIKFSWLFTVVVTPDRPKSVRESARVYAVATVDENGWILGERTPEEVAQIPQKYRTISFGGTFWT